MAFLFLSHARAAEIPFVLLAIMDIILSAMQINICSIPF